MKYHGRDGTSGTSNKGQTSGRDLLSPRRKAREAFRGNGGSSSASVIQMVERKKRKKEKKEGAHPIRSIGLVKEHIPQIVRNIRSPLYTPCHFIMQPTYRHVAFQPSFHVFFFFFFSFLFSFCVKHHPPKRG